MVRAPVCKSNLYRVKDRTACFVEAMSMLVPCPVRIDQNPDGMKELLEIALAL